MPFLPNETWANVLFHLSPPDVRAATCTCSQLAQVGDVVQTAAEKQLAEDLVEARGMLLSLRGLSLELFQASVDIEGFWDEDLRLKCFEAIGEINVAGAQFKSLAEKMRSDPIANVRYPPHYPALAREFTSLHSKLIDVSQKLMVIPVASELPPFLEDYRTTKSTLTIDEDDAETCEAEFDAYVDDVLDIATSHDNQFLLFKPFYDWNNRSVLDRSSPAATVRGLMRCCTEIARRSGGICPYRPDCCARLSLSSPTGTTKHGPRSLVR